MFDANNWYWLVADHPDSGAFSSATLSYVPSTDGTYINWLGQRNEPLKVANEIELWAAVQAMDTPPPSWLFDGTTFSRPSPTTYTIIQLMAYSVMIRTSKETGGLAINTNISVSTDLQSQAMITGAYNYATANPATTLQWKQEDGTFVVLTADEIIAVANAVGAFVQACFDLEATIASDITGGTITMPAQIDAAFAAL